ncbi:MAG: hypothetical protein IOC86_08580 [Aestuariivirga sp.]|nr:hypothetical protein [Aestuariivirga sp.]
MTWDNPHWSGRQLQNASPRQKLNPNAFARLARFCANHGNIIVLLWSVLAMVCGSYAASVLVIDPDQRPRVSLDATTAKLQAELDRQFPGIEQTFLAVVENSDLRIAREQAMALAAALSAREDLFVSAFVPGTGVFYETNALLFQSLADVRAKVDGLIQMEPLHYAMASAPDILGFASLVNEIGKAVVQGRSPPGLEAMLLAASASIEAEVTGAKRPVDWVALAGLDGDVESQRWFVLAAPRAGMEVQAAAAARQAASNTESVTWVWPRRALASAPDTARDFVVPACLSVLLSVLISALVLGSIRQTAVLMLGASVTLCCAAAVTAAMGQSLDGATWSFALAALAPVFVAGSMICTAFGGCRSKGVSITQSIMLAAHRQGGLATTAILLFAVMWVSWLVRQLPSLSHFAVIGIIACVVAWFVTMTLLPAALSVLAARRPADQPNWLDEALGGRTNPRTRTATDAVAMILLVGAIFCAAFLPAVRFGERQTPSTPPPMLETPDARGAVHILVPQDRVEDVVSLLASLPEVGAIRTATQFLPPEAPEKVAELRRLASLTPFEPAFRPPADPAQLQQSFAELEEQLTSIAVGPATSPALKEAALRLRRAVALLMQPSAPTAAQVTELERSLFGGLGDLSKLTERLAALEVPTVGSLDPRLLRRFVTEDGIWRIEVMPRSGIGELSFAASLRRTVPESAGVPLVSLARNEIIHHEAVLASAMALALASFLLLAALRNVTAWILTLVPAGAFITVTAALTATLGISLNVSMLAGLTTAMAVLIASSMRVAYQLCRPESTEGATAVAFRGALLPPMVLAAAVAPLAVSSRPAVSEVGAALAMLLVMTALLSILLVPALARWLQALTGTRRRRTYRA